MVFVCFFLLFNCIFVMYYVCCLTSEIKILYTVNHKKRDILFLTITLANLNKFL